jgi:cytochrome c-type biogenesis protein CcmH/NrfG
MVLSSAVSPLTLAWIAMTGGIVVVLLSLLKFRHGPEPGSKPLADRLSRLTALETSTVTSSPVDTVVATEKRKLLDELSALAASFGAGNGTYRRHLAPTGMILGSLLTGFAAAVAVTATSPASTAVGSAVATPHAAAFAVTASAHDTDVKRLEDYAAKLPKDRMPASTPSREVPSVATMIERLMERLRDNPKDADGWRMLGWSYRHTGDAAKAAEAYAKAVALVPSVELKAAWGEALVLRDNGTVAADTMRIFDEILVEAPDNPSARYYRGLARQASGDLKAAVADWRVAMRAPPPDAPWAAELAATIARTAKQVGIELQP